MRSRGKTRKFRFTAATNLAAGIKVGENWELPDSWIRGEAFGLFFLPWQIAMLAHSRADSIKDRTH
jgi:hypothetical protein